MLNFNFNDLEPLLATIVSLFANEGAAREVAILAEATATIEDVGSWSGMDEICILLRIHTHLFSQIVNEKQEVEDAIFRKADLVLKPYMSNWVLERVTISPELSTNPEWRSNAKVWLNGTGVNNQGRVRSDNVASKECDGLLFRSQSEIYLYQALKALGVSFAPLPVFIRGGNDYKRIEPDFVVIKDGIIMIVEVDGDTYHHETPTEAHARLTMLIHEGAILERVKASQCETAEAAKECAKQLLNILSKRKQSMK